MADLMLQILYVKSDVRSDDKVEFGQAQARIFSEHVKCRWCLRILVFQWTQLQISGVPCSWLVATVPLLYCNEA